MKRELDPQPLDLPPMLSPAAPPRSPLTFDLRAAIRNNPLHINSPAAVLHELNERRAANPRYQNWPERVDGTLLGYFPGKGPLFYRQKGHRLVLGQSGGGKGTSIIAPLLLHNDGHAAVVVDPKSGAIARATRDYRSMLGPVHIVDPYNATGLFGQGGADTYNPLSALDRDSPTLVEDAAHLARAICYDPKGTGGDTRYWDEQSRSFLTGLILHLVTQPGERADFLRLREIAVMPMEQFISDVVAKMLHNLYAGGTITRYGEEFARNFTLNPKNFDSVFSNVRSYIAWSEFQGIRISSASSSFSFRDVRRRGGTVYIVIPDARLTPVVPWLRVLLQAARLSVQQDSARTPMHFVIDETAALGRFDMITGGLRAWREDNIRLHLFFQNLSQIKEAFGDGYSAVTDAEIIQFLGTNDLETAKYVSEMIGERDMIVPTLSDGRSWGTSSGETITEGNNTGVSTGHSVSEGSSSTKTLGSNWSFNEGSNSSHGTARTDTEGSSTSQGWGESQSQSHASSTSENTTHSNTWGSSPWSGNKSESHGTTRSDSTSSSTSFSHSDSRSQSTAHGENFSTGRSQTRGKGGSDSNAEGKTHGYSTTESHSSGTSKSHATNRGSNEGQNVNRSVTVQLRRVMRPEQVRQLAEHQMVVLAGNGEAMILEREHYFNNLALVQRCLLARLDSLGWRPG